MDVAEDLDEVKPGEIVIEEPRWRPTRPLSREAIDRHEKKRLFLLKFHAMHTVNRMPWPDCAAIYEAETGEPITGDVLRLRVGRAVRDAGFVRVVEFPEKVVVSVFELTFFGCAWCAMRRFFSKIGNFWRKKPEKAVNR